MPRKYVPVAVRRAREAERVRGQGVNSSSSTSLPPGPGRARAPSAAASAVASTDYVRALRNGKTLPVLLRERWTEAARKQLSRWRRKDEYGYFHQPVPCELVPDYLDVIKKPMDFGTMETRLEQGVYSSYNEFACDFRLVCRNAMLYNGAETPYHKFAKTLLGTGERAISASIARNAVYMKRLKQEKKDYDRVLREAQAQKIAKEKAAKAAKAAKIAAQAKAIRIAKAKAAKAAKAKAAKAKAAKAKAAKAKAAKAKAAKAAKASAAKAKAKATKAKATKAWQEKIMVVKWN